jgi:hypothetical protein
MAPRLALVRGRPGETGAAPRTISCREAFLAQCQASAARPSRRGGRCVCLELNRPWLPAIILSDVRNASAPSYTAAGHSGASSTSRCSFTKGTIALRANWSSIDGAHSDAGHNLSLTLHGGRGGRGGRAYHCHHRKDQCKMYKSSHLYLPEQNPAECWSAARFAASQPQITLSRAARKYSRNCFGRRWRHHSRASCRVLNVIGSMSGPVTTNW